LKSFKDFYLLSFIYFIGFDLSPPDIKVKAKVGVLPSLRMNAYNDGTVELAGVAVVPGKERLI
jgi:hypothetical protein